MLKLKVKKHPEEIARDQRFAHFESTLGLNPVRKGNCPTCIGRDHVIFYKHLGEQLQFDAPYYQNELSKDFRSVWLSKEADPYMGGISMGGGLTYPRLSCHKSSKVDLDYLKELAEQIRYPVELTKP